jgi:hypothetical protein
MLLTPTVFALPAEVTRFDSRIALAPGWPRQAL